MYQLTKPTISGRNTIHKARGIAVVAGQQVRFSAFHAEANGFSAADTFELTCPWFVQDTPSGETVLANGPGFESVLMTQDVIPIQLYAGYPANPNAFDTGDLTQIMDGYMDTAEWDFDDTGEFVTITGRNRLAPLLDTVISSKYPNLTSSSIAAMIAQEHGLTPVVTPTTTLAGTFYNQNSTVLGANAKEWDLLLFLAKMENFIVRVRGQQLLFGPYSTVTGYVNQDPIPYTWGYDIETLKITRAPQAAKDIVVKVYSYDRNGKYRIVETARASSGGSPKQEYVETYTIPGLSRAQAQAQAKAILAQLSSAQLIGQLTGAGNTDMAIDRQIALYGVGQGLSSTYYLTRVRHTLDITSDGYSIDVSFSNQFMTSS